MFLDRISGAFLITSIKYPASSICPENAIVSRISDMPDDKNLCNVRVESSNIPVEPNPHERYICGNPGRFVASTVLSRQLPEPGPASAASRLATQDISGSSMR